MRLAKLFVWFWKKREIRPKNPDVIVSITYGVLLDRLTNCTEANTRKAAEIAQRFPNALIAFANASNCFSGSEHVEHEKKVALLKELGVDTAKVIESPIAIYNTVTEAWAIRDALREAEVQPMEITIVTEESHSRSAMYIWKTVFPNARFSLVHVPFEYAYQPDHPITFQTRPWLWILANILRHTALRVFGVKLVGKIVHHAKVR